VEVFSHLYLQFFNIVKLDPSSIAKPIKKVQAYQDKRRKKILIKKKIR